MLSSFVNQNRDNWDDLLPFLLMVYRATEHKSTKCTPNRLMFGTEIKCPLDLMAGTPPLCPIKYVEWLQHAFRESYQYVHENLKIASSRQKAYYDLRQDKRQYIVGDLVWRWYPPTANIKFGLGWTGPYKIVEKVSDLTYTIQKEEDLLSRIFNVHVDNLKLVLRNENIDVTNEIPVAIPVTSPVSDGPVAPEVPVFSRTGRMIKPCDVLDL